MIVNKLSVAHAMRIISENSVEISSDSLCSDPLLSVVFLTYNHANYVRQALDSVVSQETSFPYEILVGDDASNDGTTDIVKQYQQQYPDMIRIHLSTSGLGRYTGRGSGHLNLIRNLASARGQYVALLEGDDFWTDKEKLELQVAFLEKNRTFSGVFHDTEIDYEGRAQPWFFDHVGRVDFSLRDTIDTNPVCHTSSFVFRRCALPEMPRFLFKVQSVDMLLFTLISASGDLHRIPRTMSVYRRHKDGVVLSTRWHVGFGGALNRIHLFRNLQRLLAGRQSDRFSEVIRDNELRAVACFRRANFRSRFPMLFDSIYMAGIYSTIFLLYRFLFSLINNGAQKVLPDRIRAYLRHIL